MALNDLKLTFRDEFDSLSLDTGTSASDANFWNTSMYNGTVRSLEGNAELQWYMDPDYRGSSSKPLGVNPFEVKDGILTIKARPASSDVKSSIWGYNYTSGVLTSAGEFSQQYGYFEIRAQVPEGKGLWPAFWLLADHGKWPPELDVMEVVGDQTNYTHQTVHTAVGSNQGKATWNSEKLSAAYHTYAMDWTKDTITFYLDGKATWSMATPGDMHTSMYMVMNLAVGGNWPGSPNASTNWSTANYNIDYVRVYQHTGVAGSGSVLPPTADASNSDPADQASQLTVSNSADSTSVTDEFVVSDIRARTSTTYTANQIGLSDVPSTATLTVARGAQQDVTVTNNGAWNDIKNVVITSAVIQEIRVKNFVDVNIALTGNQHGTINVAAAKRGTVTTGSGNDVINVSAFSNGMTDNVMIIDAGDGANNVTFAGAFNSRTAITTGTGADKITISGEAPATIRSGAGNDLINGGAGEDTLIGGNGADELWGGSGADRFQFNAASDGGDLINDFSMADDLITLSGAGFGLSGTGLLAAAGVTFVNGSSPTTTDATILYDRRAGKIIWDADGTGPSQRVVLATAVTEPTGTPVDRSWVVAGQGDFNGDGDDDILWRNNAGELLIWQMQDNARQNGYGLGMVDNVWQLCGVVDFTGDGTDDLLWRNSVSGESLIWQMNNYGKVRGFGLGTIDSSWSVAGTGDFTNDGMADIIWSNRTSEEALIWKMNGAQKGDGQALGNIDHSWTLAGAGDFNNDGTDDLLWHNNNSGETLIWDMSGGRKLGGHGIGTVDKSWDIVSTADTNNDGTDDIVWHNEQSGEVLSWQMFNSLKVTGLLKSAASPDWQVVGSGDFNSDGVGDLIWRRGNVDMVVSPFDTWNQVAMTGSNFQIV